MTPAYNVPVQALRTPIWPGLEKKNHMLTPRIKNDMNKLYDENPSAYTSLALASPRDTMNHT